MSAVKARRASRVVCLASAASGAGTQAALWLIAPHLAVACAIVEIALVITVVLTALFATSQYSNRAFRLLPWAMHETGNEPTAPGLAQHERLAHARLVANQRDGSDLKNASTPNHFGYCLSRFCE